eukprot:s4385_g4.t4
MILRSRQVYSWGSGNYGRLGLGSGADAARPQLVSGVLNGYEVVGSACSWYHSAVVTSTGDVATFGSKISKCLGTAASGSDVSDGAAASDHSLEGLDSEGEDEIASVGLKAMPRARRGAVNVVQVAVGSDMLGAHTLAVSRNGRLYSWGYGPACGLGSTANVSTPTLVTKFLGTGAGEGGSGRMRKQEMEPLGWGKHSHLRYRQRPSNKHLGLQLLRPKIAKASCGGGFSVVMSTEGEVFTFGVSASGRLGFRTKFRAQLRPRRIETLAEGTIDIAAGAAFVLLCSAAGKLLSWGDNSKGQLGVGHLQESHEPLTLSRACPAAFVMQAVAAGDSHSLALDSAGRAYSWGGEGGPMTGQGQPVPNSTQVDAAFQFRLRQLSHWWVRPHPIRALVGIRVVHVDAGCLHSLALSQDGAVYAWGAPLQAGTSQNNSALKGTRSQVSWIPRLVAPSPKLPLVRVGAVAAGGWHSIATATPASPLDRLLPADWSQDMDEISFEFGVVWVCLPSCRRRETRRASPRQTRRHRPWWTSVTAFLSRRKTPPRRTPRLASSVGCLRGVTYFCWQEEARIPVCCTAIRARLAMPDGTDSPVWRALSAQVVRLRPESIAIISPEAVGREEEDSWSLKSHSDTGSESGGLLELAEMHRSRHRSVAQRKHPTTAQNSDADEAAGLALNPLPAGGLQKPKVKTGVPRKKPVPTFSSDSDSGNGGVAKRELRSKMAASRPPQVAVPKRTVPDFSSDDSASEEDLAEQELLPDEVVTAARSPPARSDATSTYGSPAASTAARSRQQPAVGHQGPASSTLSGLELRSFGEAVLAALVRYFCTNTLRNIEVIDESHPAWQREQQLRMRQYGSNPEAAEESLRPTRLRAARGLLLRQEVRDLRHIGVFLGIERLARLCDQLLLRMDAPGAPALFVPASSIGTAMWTLLQQTLRPPDRDGPDTDLLCTPPGPRKHHWGPRWLPADGHLQAHAFVLCAGCCNLHTEQRSVDGPAELAGGGRLGQRASDTSDTMPKLRLRRRDGGGGGTPTYELDLQDYPADVVFAWLRYLYTQDDLELTWPLRHNRRNREEALKVFTPPSCLCRVQAPPEMWWMQLLHLGRLVGDWKLQLYAQETLRLEFSSHQKRK